MRTTPKRTRTPVAIAIALITLLASFAIVTDDASASTSLSTWRTCRAARGQIAVTSDYDFDDTWSRLIAAVDANPNINIVKEIDHALAAENAGLTLDPNRVVVFGNPALGSPLMAENRLIGIDLPQKMQVWQDGNRVCVGFNGADYLGRRHNLGHAPQLDTIAGALAGFAEAASGNEPPSNSRGIWWLGRKDGVFSRTSDSDFDTTWNRLIAAIEASPANVAFTVDHGENSGGTLGPTRLVVFGNPNVGTPIMQSKPTAGIDLPLKILVWEADDGSVNVSANSTSFLRWRHWVWRDRDKFDPVRTAVNNFVTVAITSPGE